MSKYRVTKKAGFKLSKYDPDDTGDFSPDKTGKAKARAELAELNAKLDSLQERLYANGRRKVLVVLQGMDTAGKGGTIRRVFEGVNPSGVRVAPFKAPSEVELAHDFLWRIHPQVPGNGELVIFDRSHYEDVLIVRVRELVPETRWTARYKHIRDFEQMLVDEGTTIVKFFLHISKGEQAERLQARLDDPEKHWKFRLSDLHERQLWDHYQAAFEDAIKETSTPTAPWVVVPADHKWFRDVVVCRELVDTLESLDLTYPESPDDLTGVVVE
jgi:PPK2 family polyphosphate:nucleotide phosphotransferase